MTEFLQAQVFLLVSYSALLLLLLFDFVLTWRDQSHTRDRQHWPFRWFPTTLLVIGCSIRVCSISVLVRPPCNGNINNDDECAKINVFALGMGFSFFFGAKALIFLLLYELWDDLNQCSYEGALRRKSRVRMLVCVFIFVVFVVNTVLQAVIGFSSNNTIITRGPRHIRTYLGLGVEGAASAIIGTVGLVLGWMYSRKLLDQGARRARHFRAAAARITFACAVCFLTFWFRAILDTVIVCDFPVLNLTFEHPWEQVCILWLWEVLPAVCVIIAMGSYVRSSTFGGSMHDRLVELSREVSVSRLDSVDASSVETP